MDATNNTGKSAEDNKSETPGGDNKRQRQSEEEEDSNDVKKEKLEEDEQSKVLSADEVKAVLESGAIDGDSSFMWEMLSSASDSTCEKIETIERYMKEKNCSAVSKVLHSIKGSALMLKLDKIAELSKKGEMIFKSFIQDNEEEGEQILGQLKSEISRLKRTVDVNKLQI